MDINEFLQIINNIFLRQDTLFKIVLLIFLGVYGLYAIILYNQIRSLNNVVTQIGISAVLNFLALLHLILVFALIVFIVLSL